MSGRMKQFLVAAVASALAAVFVVAVGPGFSEPNDSAAENAVSATAETDTTEENSTYVPDPDTTPGGGDDVAANASTAEDSHGHVGSGTGTSTGSQADPGHSPNENATEDRDASNGDGTGDDPAGDGTDDCPNEMSSQNGDVDNGTPNGANYSGPYDSTCDGDISENGQGSDAPGKGTPCAGCVGNADDKQPGGQVDEFEGDKANDMGYECDGNQGVGAHYGRGNPAHTGECGSGTTNPPTCPADAEKNAGMPIPSGETAESFCTEDDSPPPKRYCPPGSDKAGQEMPEGEKASWCNDDEQVKPKRYCPPGSDKAGQEMPEGEKASWCDDDEQVTPKRYCPPGSDKAGQEMPEGEKASWCNDDQVKPKRYCPPGSDKAGQEMPEGEKASWCKDDKPTVYVCHVPGESDFVLGPLPIEALAAHLGHGDWVWTEGMSTVCGESAPPTPPCPTGSPLAGQMPPGGDYANCYFSPPPVCPVGSSMPGQTIPGNNVNNCYLTPPPVCPAGSAMAGQPVPGNNVANCYFTPPPVCPAGSDMAGQPVPGGNVNNCYESVDNEPPENNEDKVCPAGTDMAGEPVPPGGVRNCNDEVLGEPPLGNPEPNTDNPGDKGDVAGERFSNERGPLGGVLPFTGTSILAYVIVALQLIGAGALIMRGRKAKR